MGSMEQEVEMLRQGVGEGLHCSFAMPNPFVLTNKICLNQAGLQQPNQLDYNNTLLYGISKRLSNRLQLVQNAAAKLITRNKKFDHVTPLLEELHWLPVEYRMIFKMMLICFKALQGTGPLYIKDMLTIAKPKGGYNFRWSKDTLLLEQPSTRLVTYGDRSFSAAAPRHWNKLPFNIRESATVSTFITSLKTHFFKLAYKWMTFPPTAFFLNSLLFVKQWCLL